MNAQPIETEDGLKKHFQQDLENYLAETFCSILPPKKPEAEDGEAKA